MIDEPPRATALAAVVASNRSVDLLRACLDALVPQCAKDDAALIVARANDPDSAMLRAAFPNVIWVDADKGDDIPRLRGKGLAVSRALLTAVTEDHCVPSSDWLSRVALHEADDAAVIGGGMGNIRPRAIDWAAYFSEYGFFDASRPESANVADGAPLLTGANVAYRDTVRATVADWMLGGDWENTAHRRLFDSGRRLVFDPAMIVSQNRTYKFADFCLDRFEHGLDYASTRTRNSSFAARTAHAAVTPALPFLLTWRVARAAGHAHALEFTKALPTTVAFLTAWSLGEAAGYLRRRPRQSKIS